MKEMKGALSALVTSFTCIIIGLALEPSEEFGLPWIFLFGGVIAFIAGAVQAIKH